VDEVCKQRPKIARKLTFLWYNIYAVRDLPTKEKEFYVTVSSWVASETSSTIPAVLSASGKDWNKSD
jgi:hypothetical protein